MRVMREALVIVLVLLPALAAGAPLPAPSAGSPVDGLAPVAAGGPDAPRVGVGHPAIDVPYEGCAPLHLAFRIEGPDGTVGVEQLVLSEAPEGGQTTYGLRETPPVCGAPTRYYAELVLNATRALETCERCATARAQVWLDDGAATRTNDFSYAVVRGWYRMHSATFCWIRNWCETSLTVSGVEGTVELLDAPPPLLLGPLTERPRP